MRIYDEIPKRVFVLFNRINVRPNMSLLYSKHIDYLN